LDLGLLVHHSKSSRPMAEMGHKPTFLVSIKHLVGPHHQRHRDIDT
jgi:hypothetical protein